MRETQNSFNPVAPTAIVSYANVEVVKQHMLVAENKQMEVMSQEDIIEYLTHKVNNKRHENGRIYMSLEKDGTLYANSVSPYSEKFLDNIEDGVKDLVLSLRAKRYLTYSSCEGHDYTYRRYVGLAFADIESRKILTEYIQSLRIPGVKVKLLDSVINQTLNITSSKKIKYIHKQEPLSILTEEQIENETKTFNIQFHRQYERFYFMEIIILDVIPWQLFWAKTPFKNICLWIMKKYFWNYLTAKLVKGIDSHHLKKYHY